MVDFKKMAEDARKRKEQEAMSKTVSSDGNTTIQSGKDETPGVGANPATQTEALTVKDNVNQGLTEVKPAAAPEKFFAPDEMESMSGAGQENVRVTDTLLPRLAILQTLSPQLKEKKVEFIPGAALGDWCDVSVGEVFKGWIDVLPCFYSVQYIQWKKGRGGFAGNLGTDARCLENTTLNEKRQNILPNGDSIAETATWFVLLNVGFEWRRAFLPFSSTGLKISRKWLSLIRAEKLFGKNGPFTPPLFYRPWRLSVKEESNDQGDWYIASPARVPRDPDLVKQEQALIVPGRVPELNKTIYDLMAEMQDESKWLLKEAQQFYVDARDNLVVGDMGTEDINDPANARTVGGGRGDPGDSSQTM